MTTVGRSVGRRVLPHNRNPLAASDYLTYDINCDHSRTCQIRAAAQLLEPDAYFVPPQCSLSTACHNPQHRMSRSPMRHASPVPWLCPRTLLLTIYIFNVFRLIEALQCVSAPYVTTLRWTHRVDRPRLLPLVDTLN